MLIVVLAGLALYVLYLLRRPIGWLLMAAFIAMAVAGPVNRLSRRMPRGLAVALVYLGLVLTPVAIGALIVPPLVTQASQLADDVPQYAADVREWVEGNKQLHDLDQKYHVTPELEKQAAKLPSKVGDAAGTLSSLGLGLVNSIFALVNILILSIFMVSRGGAWVEAAINLRPEHERERWRRVLNHVSNAVAGYVQGALTIALIAGVATFLALTVLGVPFRAPLAVMAGLFSLIPLIGATIAAVLIGIVTLFSNFPTATIAWVVWAIVYQQVENTIIQPQVQKRTVQVPPFVVLVAVLFGSALLGVIGALVAIPVAASVMIAVREWWDWRQESRRNQIVAPDVEVPTTLITPATGDPEAPPRPA